MDKRRRDTARAKITSAVDAIRDMLRAASKAAHELNYDQLSQEDEGYLEFDRVVEPGYVVDIAAALCPAHLKVLYDVAAVLHEIEGGESERRERHLQS